VKQVIGTDRVKQIIGTGYALLLKTSLCTAHSSYVHWHVN